MPKNSKQLSKERVKAIQKANMTNVEPSMVRVCSNWPNNSWLSSTNIYSENIVKKIGKGNGKVNRQYQLSEYVAASTVLHCVIGWSFLGKAILSDLKGDKGTSGHLAYYAELRAAMSLLASNGIGVFNGCHATLLGNERCEKFNGDGTHQFTWDAFDEWSKTMKAKKLLFDVMSIGGKSASSWLIHAGLRSFYLPQKWLGQWGIDIKRLREDRDARNEFSYRPNTMIDLCTGEAIDNVKYLSDCWESCEPSGTYSFDLIDRSLLRTAIRLGFKEKTGRSYRQSSRKYRLFIERLLHAVNPTGMRFDGWVDFFNDKGTGFSIYENASKNDRHSSSEYPKQVISRAILLLRFATGSVRTLLARIPSINKNDLEFRWGRIGEGRGLWNSSSIPTDFSDLWQDVQEAIVQLQTWSENTPDSQKTMRGLWSSPECARSLMELSTTERIALWGLGL